MYTWEIDNQLLSVKEGWGFISEGHSDFEQTFKAITTGVREDLKGWTSSLTPHGFFLTIKTTKAGDCQRSCLTYNYEDKK